MFEMEKAARVILLKQINIRSDGMFIPMYLEDFSTSEEKVGFIELVFGGFMGKQGPCKPPFNGYTYNGGFVPNEKFFNRIQNRTGAKREIASVNVEMRQADEKDDSISPNIMSFTFVPDKPPQPKPDPVPYILHHRPIDKHEGQCVDSNYERGHISTDRYCELLEPNTLVSYHFDGQFTICTILVSFSCYTGCAKLNQIDEHNPAKGQAIAFDRAVKNTVHYEP